MLATRPQTHFPPLVGQDCRVPTILGATSITSTPTPLPRPGPWRSLRRRCIEFLSTYGSVHRGSGANSRWSTEIFAAARQAIVELVDADPLETLLCVTGNTTAAVNKLRRKLDLRADRGDTVLLSEFEHSSNDLPWRSLNPVRIPAGEDGVLDLNVLEDRLARRQRQATRAGRRDGGLESDRGLDAARRRSPASRTAMAGCCSSTPHNWPGIGRSRCAAAARATISTFWPFRATRCTPRSAPAFSWATPGLLAATAPDEIGGGTVDFVTPSPLRPGPRAVPPREFRHAQRRGHRGHGGGRAGLEAQDRLRRNRRPRAGPARRRAAGIFRGLTASACWANWITPHDASARS